MLPNCCYVINEHGIIEVSFNTMRKETAIFYWPYAVRIYTTLKRYWLYIHGDFHNFTLRKSMG